MLHRKKKKKKAITPFPGHCLKRLRIDYHKNEGETMRIYEAVAENVISGATLKMKFEAEDDEAAHEKIDSLNNLFERHCGEGVIIVKLLESEEGGEIWRF